MARPVVFLDDGGVMNDNTVRAPQWQRLIGEFFPPILGGTAEAWAEANRVVAGRLFEPAAWVARLQAAGNYASFERAYSLDWLNWMCAAVGVQAPPEDEAIELARRASAWVTRRVDSAFPGAVEAIRTLHERGHVLHTASGESYSDLDGYLSGMGVRDCFGHLFGPDLIGTVKAGVEFYERIFAASGVDPAQALVVDDSPSMLVCAGQVGAHTVLVGGDPDLVPEQAHRIASLAGLPGLIEKMGW